MQANLSEAKVRPVYKRFTAEERRAHVAAYFASGQSLPNYSRAHNVSKSALYKWTKIYHNETTKTASFIPIALPTLGGTPIIKPYQQELHIIIKSEVKLVIPELVDITAVVKLIKALSACN